MEQGGIAFQVRVVTDPAKQPETSAAQPRGNPFLPYDPDLFVADISPTHVALLNKYNVVDHHLLIVTRSFEDQQTPLTQKDCEALLIALTEIDGLVFYNAGPAAGASQPHKHLQMIPFPDPATPRLPVEPLLRPVRMTGCTGLLPDLPFRHAYAPMDPEWTNPQKECGASLLACYRALLRAAGVPVAAIAKPSAIEPYNLLVTRQWLLLVPRSQEYFKGISINALGFAGTILTKNEAQLADLRKYGPMTALQHVALPREL